MVDRPTFPDIHTFKMTVRPKDGDSWPVDAVGRLLLQKIPPEGKRHPGHWGSSVAGYVFAGETYEQAARRRVGEELGNPWIVELARFGNVAMHDQGCKKFAELFTAQHDGPFRYDSSQIAAIQFVSIDDIRRMQLGGERSFTPTFLKLFEYYQGLSG